jgi:hypothetical protein
MLSTVKFALSLLVPTVTNPVLLFWQNTPYGVIFPSSFIGKSQVKHFLRIAASAVFLA